MSPERIAARSLLESNIRQALRECKLVGPLEDHRLNTITEHIVWSIEQRWCREALTVLARDDE